MSLMFSPLPAPGLMTATQPSPDYGMTQQDVGFATATGTTALLGQPTPTSTSKWTPQAAAEQTDRALARIAQTNPEVAQALAEAQDPGSVSPPEGGGLLDGIKNAIGQVMDITGLDTVLEVMSRPSHLVPEFIHGLAQGEDFGEAVWSSVSDSLMGRSETSWDDVLAEDLGLGRNFFTAALGFAGDVATDPLTYVTFGAGGMARQAAAKSAGTAAIESELLKGGSALVEDFAAKVAPDVIAAQGGREAAAARYIFGQSEPALKMAERANRGLVGRVRTAMGIAHPDAAGGAVNYVLGDGLQAEFERLLTVGNEAFTAQTTTGFSRLTAEAAAKMGFNKEEVETILRQRIASGSGFDVSKEAYLRGREAGAVLGGWRLRASFPMFNIRLQTQPMAFIPRTMDFSVGRRLFAGLSGSVRLSRMVGAGDATLDDLRMFYDKADGGFRGLKEHAPNVARQLGEGYFHTASIFIPLSESLGRATKHLAPSAAVMRGGGLGAAYARDSKIAARQMESSLIDDIFTVLKPGGGTVTNEAQIREHLIKASGGTRFGRLANPEKAAEVLDALNEVARLGDNIDPVTLQKAKATLGPEADALMEEYQAILRQGEDVTAAHGDLPDSVEYDLHTANEVNPADMEAVQGMAAPSVRDTEWVMERPVLLEATGGALNKDILENASEEGSVIRGAWFRSRTEEDELAAALDTKVTADDIDSEFDKAADGLGMDSTMPGRVEEADEVADAARSTRETIAGQRGAKKPGTSPDDAPYNDAIDRWVETGEWDEAVLGPKSRFRVANKIPKADWDAANDVQARSALPESAEAEAQVDYVAKLEQAALDAQTPGGTLAGAKEAKSPQESLVVINGSTPEEMLESILASQKARTATIEGQAASATRKELGNPRMAVRPLNVLEVDHSPVVQGAAREATETIDELAMVEAKMREFFEKVKEGDESVWGNAAEEISPQVQERVRQLLLDGQTLNDQIGPMVTAELKARGWDAVKVKVKDGDYRLALLADEKGNVPAARVSDTAPRVKGAGQGVQAFEMSDGVLNAIGRQEGLGEAFKNKLMRAIQNMSRPDAERYIRSELNKVGINLRDKQTIFVTDPLAVLHRRASRIGKRAAQRQLGHAIQHGENLGLTKGAWGGGAVGLAKYEYVVNPVAVKAASEVSEKYKAAADRAAALQATEIPDRMAALSRAEDRLIAQEAAAEELDATLTERATRVLDDIADRTDPNIDDDMASDIVGDLAATQEGLATAIARGNAERLTDLPDGRTVWKVTVPEEEGLTPNFLGGDAYVMTDDTGKVIGHRDVLGSRAEIERRVIGQARSDRGGRLEDALDNEVIRKNIHRRNLQRGVVAVTDPAVERTGVGGALRRAHWEDIGVYDGTPEEVFDNVAEAVTAQSFSTKGGSFAAKVVTETKDQLISGAKSAAKKEKAAAREARTRANWAQAQHRDAMAEQRRLLTKMQTTGVGPLASLVPAENALNMAGMQQLHGVPGFRDLAMPNFMAQEFKQALQGYPALDGAHREWRRFNSWWKEHATLYWPGFHVRNSMGAFFNNWLGGVGFRDYVTQSRVHKAGQEIRGGILGKGKWATTKVAKQDGDIIHLLKQEGIMEWGGVPIDDITYADLYTLQSGMGITASNGRTFAEPRLTAETAEARRGRTKVGRAYKEGARETGTVIENTFRGANFISGLRQGQGTVGARASVMMRHGDYADLTDFEYKTVRDLIPFYKWMRTNVPFQVHQLLENPGKLLAVDKLQGAAFTAAGYDWREERKKMPEWMADRFLVPLPGGEAINAVMLDLPMADLHQSGREFMSSFLPTVRPFLESYVLGQSIYTGRPLEGEPVPLPSGFGVLGRFMSHLGITEVGPDGQTYIDDKLQNTLGTIPVFSRFRDWLYDDPDRARFRSNALASAIFGVGLRPIDEEEAIASELDFYYSQVLPAVDHLKSMGYPVPTSADIPTVLGGTDRILAGLGIESQASKYAEAS